jgi:hypothetical protein
VPARVYSVRHNDTVLKVTVAEIGNTGRDEGTVIDCAIKILSRGGEVKDNIPQRVDPHDFTLRRDAKSRSTRRAFRSPLSVLIAHAGIW